MGAKEAPRHMGPGQKATPEGLKGLGLELSVPLSVSFASWELCAQHLSKSPKGKRAIPRSGGGDCHPKAWSVHPPSPQWLVWTLLGSSLGVLCFKTRSKGCSCVFCTNCSKWPGEGAGLAGDVTTWLPGGAPPPVIFHILSTWIYNH